jgi:hypothetical protein
MAPTLPVEVCADFRIVLACVVIGPSRRIGDIVCVFLEPDFKFPSIAQIIF